MSWLLPPNRSASVSLPFGPSKTYFFSTFSQGSSRRCRLSSSRTRENSFSFFNSSLRAASHAAGGTTFGCSIALVAMTDSPFQFFHRHGRTDDPRTPWRTMRSVNAGVRWYLAQTNFRILWPFTKCRAGFGALGARGLRLGRLSCLLHLREHFANGFVGSWAALLAPRFQVVALFFQIGEEVWAAEHGALRAEHRLHLFKNNPLLPVAFEEEFFVDQPAVDDARHHLPVTDHHAQV